MTAARRAHVENLGRDAPSLEALYERHRRALWSRCRRLMGDEHDAADLLQVVALRVLLALRRGAHPEHERAWLFRIAHNEAMNIRRAPGRPVTALEETLESPQPGPLRTVLHREQLDEIFHDVGALSPYAREILLRAELEGHERAAIAETMGVSVGAVSQSLLESRATLRLFQVGREMTCENVRALLSEQDGRRCRARPVLAHLRGCQGCRAWKRNRRWTRLAAMPAPAAALFRWASAAVNSPLGTIVNLRGSGLGNAKVLALVASIGGGVAGGAALHREVQGRVHPHEARATSPARIVPQARGGASATHLAGSTGNLGSHPLTTLVRSVGSVTGRATGSIHGGQLGAEAAPRQAAVGQPVGAFESVAARQGRRGEWPGGRSADSRQGGSGGTYHDRFASGAGADGAPAGGAGAGRAGAGAGGSGAGGAEIPRSGGQGASARGAGGRSGGGPGAGITEPGGGGATSTGVTADPPGGSPDRLGGGAAPATGGPGQ